MLDLTDLDEPQFVCMSPDEWVEIVALLRHCAQDSRYGYADELADLIEGQL